MSRIAEALAAALLVVLLLLLLHNHDTEFCEAVDGEFARGTCKWEAKPDGHRIAGGE